MYFPALLYTLIYWDLLSLKINIHIHTAYSKKKPTKLAPLELYFKASLLTKRYSKEETISFIELRKNSQHPADPVVTRLLTVRIANSY
jgi:hypothetical protein